MDGALAMLQKFTSSQREIEIPIANDASVAADKGIIRNRVCARPTKLS